MANLHEQAVDLALRANDDLAGLFARMGHAAAPRGQMVTAYRQARAALRGHLDDKRLVQRQLRELDAALRASVARLVTLAVDGGQRYGQLTLDIYGESFEPVRVDTTAATDAWLTPWEQQRRRILGAGELDEALVFGRGGGLGWLTPGPMLQEGSRWLGLLFGQALADALEASIPDTRRDEFMKQAVAALDERTTDCCLRVHGQTQPINGEFVLTGEPRYADRIDWAPFHWWCRTATALVTARDANDALSRQMRAAARAERLARQDKSREEIHPADARSRR